MKRIIVAAIAALSLALTAGSAPAAPPGGASADRQAVVRTGAMTPVHWHRWGWGGPHFFFGFGAPFFYAGPYYYGAPYSYGAPYYEGGYYGGSCYWHCRHFHGPGFCHYHCG